jgi:hypothetical protein
MLEIFLILKGISASLSSFCVEWKAFKFLFYLFFILKKYLENVCKTTELIFLLTVVGTKLVCSILKLSESSKVDSDIHTSRCNWVDALMTSEWLCFICLSKTVTSSACKTMSLGLKNRYIILDGLRENGRHLLCLQRVISCALFCIATGETLVTSRH